MTHLLLSYLEVWTHEMCNGHEGINKNEAGQTGQTHEQPVSVQNVQTLMPDPHHVLLDTRVGDKLNDTQRCQSSS